MPELPEVETTVRGIAPALRGKRLEDVVVRNPQLRWPVVLPDAIRGQRFQRVGRRAKYLLLELETGVLIIHLGMSGRLRVTSNNVPPEPHDHVDFLLEGGRVLRYTDPRRFGSMHWQPPPLEANWLLRNLGVEPLGDQFDGQYLFRMARGRRVAVKNFLMDGRVVVGVGNIYANEALFHAGIRPRLQAGGVSRRRFELLAAAVRQTLTRAIELGGTTLRDFLDSDGRPGYFVQELSVYGRERQPCRVCGVALKGVRVGQRATVYCPKCQR